MHTPPLNPGDTLLGKYRVERILGQGGMGVVVAARHLELGELYAIKVMLPHMLDDQDAVGRFLREARASARLKGEHVARVHDVGHADDGTLFMVMEYLDGIDLKRHLADCGRLPLDEAITYVRQACEAIVEAHENGIIHRDIKPANLFLTRKRKAKVPQIKVLDFGISKEMKPEPGQDLTKTGTMLGSPLYMSPEQMIHARHVDARTDIWALGVVFYELLTGVVPFPGETFTQVVHGVLSLTPKSIRSHVPELPGVIDSVIMRCLAKDPNSRYPTVEAFAEALDRALEAIKTGQALDVDPILETAKEEERLPAIALHRQDMPMSAALDSTVEQVQPTAYKSTPLQDSANPLVDSDKRDAQRISDKTNAAMALQPADTGKREAPMATTLPSVSPPPLETTSPPRKLSPLAIVGVAAAAVLCVLGYLQMSSLTDTKTNAVVGSDDHARSHVEPLPTPLPPSAVVPIAADSAILQPSASATTQVTPTPSTSTAPSANAIASAITKAAPVVRNGAAPSTTTPTEAHPPAGTTTAAPTTAPASSSDSTRWRQGPL